MLLCGLDFETTGLCSEENRVTEIGAVLWCTEKRSPMEIYSVLVNHSDIKEVSDEITRITGIDFNMLQEFGINEKQAFLGLDELASKAEYFVAHNAPFDKAFYDAEKARHKEFIGKNIDWIDTYVDVPYHESIGTRKLTYLATEHNFLNPFAHRAVFDVLTMMKVISNYDIEEIVKLSKEPNVSVRAVVMKPWHDEGKQTGVAKELGYKWEGKRKLWLKQVKSSQVPKELQKAEEAGIQAAILPV